MPDQATLSHWKRRARVLTEGLLERVDELSVSDFPTATPNQVIKFIQDFLAEILKEIDAAESEPRLRSFCLAVLQLAQSLDWLDNAHTAQTPRGLVQVLRHLIDEISPGARVVARPQAQYNYSIADLGSYFRRLVDDYIPDSRQHLFNEHLSTPLKLISFPRIERDNLLAHTIFGHELGHPIASDYLGQEEILDAYKVAQADVQKQVVALVEHLPNLKDLSNDDKDRAKISIFNTVLQVRRRAMEELISDAVGIFVFGPSALFAMFELLWQGNWDSVPSAGEWYPPSRLRIRLMLRLPEATSAFAALWVTVGEDPFKQYTAATRAFFEQATSLAGKLTDDVSLKADPVLKIAYEWMETSLPAAIEFAREQTRSVVFGTEPSFSQLSRLIQRLELGIPQNEVGEPNASQVVDYRAALLAAWMFKLRGVSPKTGEALSSKEEDHVHKRTMRAIEYIFLQNEYGAHMAAVDRSNTA